MLTPPTVDACRPAGLQQALDALCALEGLGRFVLYVSQVSSPDMLPCSAEATIKQTASETQQSTTNSPQQVLTCRGPMQAGGNDAVRAVISSATRRLQQRARKFERWMYKPAQRHQQVVVVCAHYPVQTVSMACAC